MYRLNILYKQSYITLNDIWLYESYTNAPSTCSETGGKQWQHSIRGWRNYPLHFYELPSPFLRITLAIFASYPRHPHNNALNCPCALYRITFALEFIFPAWLPGYTSMNAWNYVSIQVVALWLTTWVAMANFVYIKNGTIRSKSVRVGFPGAAILARVIRNTLARYRTVIWFSLRFSGPWMNHLPPIWWSNCMSLFLKKSWCASLT